MEHSEIDRLRHNIDKNIGRTIRLTFNRGRRKAVIKKGVLESTYKSVFVVRIISGKSDTVRASYSYTDVLTKEIEIALYKTAATTA